MVKESIGKVAKGIFVVGAALMAAEAVCITGNALICDVEKFADDAKDILARPKAPEPSAPRSWWKGGK
jgi:uncharacterized protein (DUF1778 family)